MKLKLHLHRTQSIILIFSLLLQGCSFPTRSNNATNSSRPNLILIITDDLDFHLGSIGYMQNLQKLIIAEGLSFNNFYVTTPLCCPSRVTFLRGQYPHNHGIFTNAPPSGGFDAFTSLDLESSTLATWLQAAGYRTVMLGKYLNGFPNKDDHFYIPPGWSEWYAPVRGKPYAGRDYQLNDNGKKVNFGDQPEDYLTDVLAQRAVNFIRNVSKESAPFFMYFSTYAPHEPARPAQRHQNLFNDIRAPQPPSFNEEDVGDKPEGIKGDPLLTQDEIIEINERYITRLRSMQAVDEMIAKLVQVLDKTNQLDNTYIVFTSDNGFHLGQHRLKKGKGTPYLEDIQVPFIVRGPEVVRGEVLDGYIVGNIDLAPTFAELAGIKYPEFVDGRSLVPLFTASRPPIASWRQALLLEQFKARNANETDSTDSDEDTFSDQIPDTSNNQELTLLRNELVEVLYLGLITPRYKFVEYGYGFRELYDLANDPYELNNIALSTNPEILEQFSAWLREYSACSTNGCKFVEEKPVPEIDKFN